MNNRYFEVTDNSGVQKVLVITNLTRKGVKINIGDLVVGVVKKSNWRSNFTASNIVYAVVVRLKTGLNESKWVINFNDNSLVLVDKNLNPVSSRIFGTIPTLLKDKGCLKLNSLAVEYI